MLILVAHGSRDPRWRESLHALTEAVAARLPSEEVRLAFMQFEGPTLPETVEKAVQSGSTRLRMLPLFMASAGHVDKDIKPLIAQLARSYPDVEMTLLTPVGEDDLFPRMIADLVSGSPGDL
jgi:sirohydrochlorin cobaltochelatase